MQHDQISCWYFIKLGEAQDSWTRLIHKCPKVRGHGNIGVFNDPSKSFAVKTWNFKTIRFWCFAGDKPKRYPPAQQSFPPHIVRRAVVFWGRIAETDDK